jgi:hypothetical protein
MKREDVLRLKRAIESDRMSMTAEGLDIIIADVQSVLSDYFYISKVPTLEIKAQGGAYAIEIKVQAEAIKTFAKIS